MRMWSEETWRLANAVDQILKARYQAEQNPQLVGDRFPDCGIPEFEHKPWGRDQILRNAELEEMPPLKLMVQPESDGSAVRIALRMALHAIGSRLHEIGGTFLMQQVADAVLPKDEKSYSLKLMVSLFNSWNGIGGRGDTWLEEPRRQAWMKAVGTAVEHRRLMKEPVTPR